MPIFRPGASMAAGSGSILRAGATRIGPLTGIGAFLGGVGKPPPVVLANIAGNSFTGGTLENLFSVSRAQTVSSYAPNTNGSLAGPFAANTARWSNLGLLEEASSTNLILQSGDLTQAAWSSAQVSITTSSQLAPDGVSFMSLLTNTFTGNNTHTRQSQTLTANTVYSLSGYFKAGTAPFFLFGISDFTANAFSIAVNATTLAVTTSPVGAGSIISYKITPLTDGSGIVYWQLQGKYSSTISGAFASAVACSAANGATISGQTGLSWGLQFEASSSSSSYIPTTTAAVTRNADVITASGLLASTLALSAASVSVLTNHLTQSSASTLIDANGTTLLGKNVGNMVATAVGAALASANFTTWATPQAPVIPANTGMVSSGLGWDSGGGIIQLQAGVVATDITARTPVGPFYLGSTQGTSNHINGFIAEIIVYDAKVSQPASITGFTPPFDPSLPSASGYGIKLQDTFTSLSTIDLANTQAAGFNWYVGKPFGYATSPSSFFSLAGGTGPGLVITPTSDATNFQLCTTVPSLQANRKSYSGGLYFEASIKFDPTRVVGTLNGWPAIWSLPTEKMDNPPTTDQWPGQAVGYEHWIENDFFEYLSIIFGKGDAGSYGATMHDWFGTSPTFAGNIQNASNNIVETPSGISTVWTNFHKISQLWVPATSTSLGYVANYFDNVLLSVVTWAQDPNTSPPPAQPWSLMDSEHMSIILGTGNSMPLTIEFVRVWQNH